MANRHDRGTALLCEAVLHFWRTNWVHDRYHRAFDRQSFFSNFHFFQSIEKINPVTISSFRLTFFFHQYAKKEIDEKRKKFLEILEFLKMLR